MRLARSIGWLLRGPERRIIRVLSRTWRDERFTHRRCRVDELLLTAESVAAQRRYRDRIAAARPSRGLDYHTVFILGSGPSINELGPRDWRHIASHESWGFNFWFVHDHVPNFYVAQVTKNNRLDLIMARLLQERAHEYTACEFLIRGDVFNRHQFHQSEFGKSLLKSGLNAKSQAELYFKSYCEEPPENLLNILTDHGYFRAEPNELPCPKFGSTVTLMIALAVRYRFRKIVLCGIDMNDATHFYDVPEYRERSAEVRELTKGSGEPRRVHQHVDLRERNYTVKEHVVAMADHFGAEFDTQLFVSSARSALYPDVPLYEFPHTRNGGAAEAERSDPTSAGERPSERPAGP